MEDPTTTGVPVSCGPGGLPSPQLIVAEYSLGPVSGPPGTVKRASDRVPVGKPWKAVGAGGAGRAFGAKSTTVAEPCAATMLPPTSLMVTSTGSVASSA